jgi:hypothetical protein
MFRFTIRDVLWLMVVIGLSVGWWRDHRQSRWSTYIWMCRAVQSNYALKQLDWSVDWTGPRTEFKNSKTGETIDLPAELAAAPMPK